MMDSDENFVGDPARATLAALIIAAGEDYKSLSRLIGRNAAYIHQYLFRGTPRRLGERERALLSEYFGVDEQKLGGPARKEARLPGRGLALVPRLDVGASAGAGALAEDDRVAAPFAFDEGWLRRLSAQPKQLAIIRVEGDSMVPTLSHGDDIMVDSGDDSARMRDGIYVLRLDGMLLVKRLARAAPLPEGQKQVTIISDNPAYPTEIVAAESLEIVGRVVWAGRRII
jgi:phage repressor protein C with HTH and peptisase S24 domain